MIFTKIWTALLACLATAFLAGMFVLSMDTSDGFSDADKTAIRTVTQAGIAAIEADMRISPVNGAHSLLEDPRVKKPFLATASPSDIPSDDTLRQNFEYVANETLLASNPQLSVALLDPTHGTIGQAGRFTNQFELLQQSKEFIAARSSPEPQLFTSALSGQLFAVKLDAQESGPRKRRTVAIQPVDLGGESFLRRVLGAGYPAGLVKDNDLVGEVVGGASESILVQMVREHIDRIPTTGVTEVFTVGEGPDSRIGAIGRIEGEAGTGDHATYFVVYSRNTQGFAHKDLWQRMKEAQSSGHLMHLNWPLIAGLLAISLILSIYLPHVEFHGPVRRLTLEFISLSKRTQHQLNHDSYTGAIGKLAHAAAMAFEAIKTTWEEARQSDGMDDRSPDVTALPPGSKPGKRRYTGRKTVSEPNVSASDSTSFAGLELDQNNSSTTSSSPSSHSHGARTSTATGAFDEAVPMLDPVTVPSAEPSRESRFSSRTDPMAVSANQANKRDNDTTAFDNQSANPKREQEAATSLLDAMSDAVKSGMQSGGKPSKTKTRAEVTVAAFPPAPPANERESYFREIYEQFLQTKVTCGEATDAISYEKFASKLAKNIEELTRKPGIKDVQFSVYVKDGKAALKAKIIKGAS